MSVLFALFKRESTGMGDSIEVPLASALMEGLAYNSQYIEDYPQRYKGHREIEIERRRQLNAPMDMQYTDLQEYLDPFYRNYRCKDGRFFYVVSASHKDHPVRILKLMGLWDQLVEQGLPQFNAYLDSDDWPDNKDCSLSNYPLSPKWSGIISAQLKKIFLTKTAYEWEELFAKIGAPGAAQRSSKEWMNSEHAQKSGLILKVQDQVYGEMLQFGNVAWLKGDKEAIKKQSAPSCNQDREKILKSLGGKRSRKDSVKTNEGWLKGVKVLDLTNVIAGPTIAATMARFGAEIISLDPVNPTMDPWCTVVFGMHANRGKRSLLIDLKSPQARPLIDKLIKQVDVITINAFDSQLDSLGLDYGRIKSINPKVILCQLDCYGGPDYGSRSDTPGYDDLAQASTGVMLRFGGGMATPEEHAHFGTIDVLGGFCAAVAVGAALYQRELTGEGDIARASLCAAGNLIQAPFMYDYSGRGEFDEPSGRDVKGYDALYRTYQAEDGWFFLAMKRSQQQQLSSIEKLIDGVDLPLKELDVFFESVFITMPVNFWVQRLLKEDIAAQPLGQMHSIRENFIHDSKKDQIDLATLTFSFVRHANHPSGHSVDLVTPNAIRSKESRVMIPCDAPKYGAHTREILSELDLEEADIDQLVAQGVVATSWSKNYLPM